MDFVLDRISLWIGLIFGGILIWIFPRIKPYFGDVIRWVRSLFGKVQAGFTAPVDELYQQELIMILQDKHLAGTIFSFEEVAMRPRVLVPPPSVDPGENLPMDDAASRVVPFMPANPVFSSIFNGLNIDLLTAISGGAHLLLVGPAGSGKSFAFRYEALRIMRPDKQGNRINKIPVLVHAADLDLSRRREPVSIIAEAQSSEFSSTVSSNFNSFLNKIFDNGIGLLFVDGLDEMPPKAVKAISVFLEQVSARYPLLQMMIAADPACLPHSEELELHPYGMKVWGPSEKRKFIKKWNNLWVSHVMSEVYGSRISQKTEPLVLRGWLNNDTSHWTPLEFTLKVWGVFAGDLQGPTVADSIHAHVQRISAGISEKNMGALEQLAAQMAISNAPVMSRGQAGRFVQNLEDSGSIFDTSEFEASMLRSLAAQTTRNDEFAFLDELIYKDEDEEVYSSDKPIASGTVRRLIPQMISNKVLTNRMGERISFAHPVFAGYFAGRGLANLGGEVELIKQADWSGKTQALEYFGVMGDASSLANRLLQTLDDQRRDAFRTNLMIAGNWLKNAPLSRKWRPRILRDLAMTINRSELPLGLRQHLALMVVQSRDPGVYTMFRKMMLSPQDAVRVMGALGCGLLNDTQSTNDLGGLIYDPSPLVSRSAILALTVIDTPEAIEIVARTLLEAPEDVRRAAAEALAYHSKEGHPIIKEGAEHNDILVRRAVVFGLALIRERWSHRLLNHIQVEDAQWVVRSAAVNRSWTNGRNQTA